jgi:hypothetical protein
MIAISYWVKFFDILEEVIEKENNSRDGCWLWIQEIRIKRQDRRLRQYILNPDS